MRSPDKPSNQNEQTPLKILMALQYYVPHRTGLTLHVQRLAEALAERGHHVTVLTARYNKELARDEQVINGVRVIRLWAPLRVSRGMIMPAYLWAAYRLIKMHDVVSIHTPVAEAALVALLCRLLGKKLVIREDWKKYIFHFSTGRNIASETMFRSKYFGELNFLTQQIINQMDIFNQRSIVYYQAYIFPF